MTPAPSTPSESILTRALQALWDHRPLAPRHLAQAAGIPETGVPSLLAALRQRQCLIEQDPAGLTLIQTGLTGWRDIITARRTPGQLGARTLVFQSTGSTNDVCWQHAADPAAHGLVVLAEQQTSGRGRRGQPWVAAPGQAILLSILLRDMAALNLDTFTLQLGLAAALAIEQTTALEAAIKWPNDVLLDGRKVAGVLVEARPAATPGRQHVVLGIGVNVAQAAADFPETLRLRATSIYQATGRHLDRLALIMALLEKIAALCLPDLPSDQWLPAWKARCPTLGQAVTARCGPEVFVGQIQDIDPFHGLILLDQSGTRHFLGARTTTLS